MLNAMIIDVVVSKHNTVVCRQSGSTSHAIWVLLIELNKFDEYPFSPLVYELPVLPSCSENQQNCGSGKPITLSCSEVNTCVHITADCEQASRFTISNIFF